MDTFIQQIINGLVLGSVYALVALGYTMVYGIINLINFAHGEVLMVGALTSWTVVVGLAGLGLPGWLLLLISLIAAIVVCSVLNYSIEKITQIVAIFETAPSSSLIVYGTQSSPVNVALGT